jgi:hypothetical protein
MGKAGCEEGNHTAHSKAISIKLVEDKTLLPKEAGVHGQSIFMRLHYVDQLNLYPIPIGHAALLDVMRNFWAAMIEKPTKGQPYPP